MDVVLLGFPSKVADELQASLPSTQIKRHYADNPALPMVPTVHYQVRALSECSSDLFLSSLQPAPERLEFLDGNLAESSLAVVLRDAGLNLSRDRPALVFIHLGDDRLGDHSFLNRGEADWGPGVVAGWVDHARVFGGREPFMAMDVSAREDPDDIYGSQENDYEKPIALDDDALVPVLVHAIQNATVLRFYPDMNWPPTTAPCNAFTVLYAVRATSLGSTDPGMHGPEGQVRGERLAKEFTELSGKPSYVDIKILNLPVDDPELDAVARIFSGEASLGETANPIVPDWWQYSNMILGLVNDWVEQNWDRYWVPHAGCEGYLGILVWNDAADYPHASGTSFHPSLTSRRWMMGQVGTEAQTESNNGPWSFQVADYLLAHEFGHAMGLHHPHRDATTSPPRDDWAFSKAISGMSYPWYGRTVTFSAMEETTMVRNEVGFALLELHAAGRAGGVETEAALAALEHWDWRAAMAALRPLLDAP